MLLCFYESANEAIKVRRISQRQFMASKEMRTAHIEANEDDRFPAAEHRKIDSLKAAIPSIVDDSWIV